MQDQVFCFLLPCVIYTLAALAHSDWQHLMFTVMDRASFNSLQMDFSDKTDMNGNKQLPGTEKKKNPKDLKLNGASSANTEK